MKTTELFRFPAEYDGLRFIFKEHLVQVKEAVQNPSLVEEQYAKLSTATGFVFLPSESYLDWMGNFCLEKKKNPKLALPSSKWQKCTILIAVTCL